MDWRTSWWLGTLQSRRAIQTCVIHFPGWSKGLDQSRYFVFPFPIQSQLKDERQVRPEIHVLFSPVAIKFNFEQRCRSRSGCENSTFNYFL